MSYKILGIIFIVTGCGGFGFLIAGAHRNSSKQLQQLIRILNTMECELRYRMTPLPELCRISAEICAGKLQVVFLRLAERLDHNSAVNVSQCMLQIISQMSAMPKQVEQVLGMLGDCLGRFDLEGQLKGILYVRSTCEDLLRNSMLNQDIRIHSYQTLAICAGAALAILLV